MRIGQQVVVGDTKYTFTLPKGVNNLVIFDVHNDSPYNMGISFGRDTTITNCDYYTSPHGVLTGIVPPSIDKRTIGGVRWNGIIYVYTETPAGGGGTTNLANAPASSVTIIGYQAGYQPQGQVALNRMQTTANTVDTNVGSLTANSVTNDGNTAPATFIEASQSGNASGSNVAIGNDGSFVFAQFVSSVLTQYLKGVPGANPLIEIGAKALLQMADYSGVLGTVLKIDSGGNTVFQQHPTAQEFDFVDKNGNILFVIDNTGHLVVNNNQSIRARDTGGTPQALFKYDTSNNVLFVCGTSGFLEVQDNNTNKNFITFSLANGIQMANSTSSLANVFGVDSSGNTYVQNHSSNNQTVIYDKNGVALLTVDANAMINVAGATQNANGDTSGSSSMIEMVYGAFKICVYKQNNYRQNSATPNTFTLKQPFTFGAFWVNAGCGNVLAKQNGSNQTTNEITWGTGTSVGSTAGSTIVNANAAGIIQTNFNQVSDAGSYANAHTGFTVFIGQ